MREMKDSGIEWIGEIPVDWSMKRVKHIFTRKNEKAMQENPTILSLARDGVKVRDISNNEGQIAESYYNYNPVEEGDLLLNPMDLYSGANCSISKVQGVISPAYINLKANAGVNPAFYDYYFKVQYWLMAFFSYGKGVSYDNRWTLSAETLMNYPVVALPYGEQCKRADYLDRKCSQIDAIIARQQEVIEKLKAYKLSIITEAVTKGLNPDAPMKNSGIEWIGEIPEHWQAPKIKYLATIASGGTPDRSHPEYWNGSINWAKTGELKNSELYETEEKITELALENSSAKVFNIDTILVAMYGQGKTRGMTALLKVPSATNQACAGITVYSKDITVSYLWLFLMGAYDAIREKANGSGQPNLSGALIADFNVTLPPIEEQMNICKTVAMRLPHIDCIIKQKETIVDKLTAYKKSLIYEVVTGKRCNYEPTL